jgi:hypothetical protein
MTTQFECVWDYFDANPLPPLSTMNRITTDESERLERFAIPALDSIFSAEIEEFDCHDAINTIADTYEVERSDLLEYYDNKF